MRRDGDYLFVSAGICAVLALCIWLLFAGYAMTALCFLGLSVCLFLYGLMRRFPSRLSKRLAILLTLFLALGVGCFLSAEIPILADARSDPDTDADYAVVFGAHVVGSVPSVSLADRLSGALQWAEAHPGGKLIVSGGCGKGESMSEAQAMFDWLTAQGVDPERILLEDRSENSYQNLLYSLEVLRQDGGDPAGRVALISSEYHLNRLCYIAERLGCQPVKVAADTRWVTLEANYAVREAFALWKCRLLGIE